MQGTCKKSDQKQVMFSDGIRPGGDLTELDGSDQLQALPRQIGRPQKTVDNHGMTCMTCINMTWYDVYSVVLQKPCWISVFYVCLMSCGVMLFLLCMYIYICLTIIHIPWCM